MRLQFTKDIGERFRKGGVYDYPRATWEQIARNVGLPLDKFTKPVNHDVPTDSERRMDEHNKSQFERAAKETMPDVDDAA